MPWQFKGLTGLGSRPSVVDSEAGICLILGGGWCLWDDVRAFYKLVDQDFENEPDFQSVVKVMAVNLAAAAFKPGVDHIVSHHDPYLAPLAFLTGIRQPKPKPCMTHSNTASNRDRFPLPTTARRELPFIRADYYWGLEVYAGTSTLLAVAVAIGLGFSRIVLAGVPLDDRGHFFYDDKTTNFADQYVFEPWREAEGFWMKDRVRSMSGRTKELLGAPDRKWLNSK